MEIEYRITKAGTNAKHNAAISKEQFVDLLGRSTLGQRRPTHDKKCMADMVAQCDLMVSAWQGDQLVGVARSLTDFAYACYVSELAVDESLQSQGIGKHLLSLTQAELGRHCTIILIASPAAKDYYQHIGFEHHPRCWVLDRDVSL